MTARNKRSEAAKAREARKRQHRRNIANAEACCALYVKENNGDDQFAPQDLICNLMHVVEKRGGNAIDALYSAIHNWYAEANNERSCGVLIEVTPN